MPAIGRGRAVPDHGLPPAERRALGCMPFLVPIAQVQSNELPIAVRKVALVDLLRVMVELMSITGTW